MSEREAMVAKHARLMSVVAHRIEDIRRRQAGVREHLRIRLLGCACEYCLTHLGTMEIERRLREVFNSGKEES